MENSETEKTILVTVLRVLEDVTFQPMRNVKLTDHLVYDLDIDTDDLTDIFVNEIQDRLSIKIPNVEWTKTGTIQQVVEMLKKYYPSSDIGKFS